MAIVFQCRNCERLIKVRYLEPGEEAQCKTCGIRTVVPEVGLSEEEQMQVRIALDARALKIHDSTGDSEQPTYPEAIPKPVEVESGPRPEFVFHSPNSMAIATFIGSPIAGAALMANNYRHTNQTSKAGVTLLMGFVLTALVAYFLSAGLPSLILNAGVLVIPLLFLLLCKLLQGSAYREHRRLGGSESSSWKALSFGLLFLLGHVLLLTVFGVLG